MRRGMVSAGVCVALLGGLPAAASGVGLGTPGKVATITAGGPVRIWDPVQAAAGSGQDAGWTTIADKAYPSKGEYTISAITRPQWSPDGTQLVFTRSALDPGDPIKDAPPLHQTSIWIYTVATGQIARLTTPPPNLVDHDEEDVLEIRHMASDYAPTFSPDGTTVAFVRHTRAGQDDELRKDEGMQVWTVPAAGGSATRRTSLGEDSVLFMLQWIPGTQDLLAAQGTDSGLRAARVSLGGGAAPLAGTTDLTAPSGLDVSPDGTRFTYMGVSESGFTAHVMPIAGGTDVATFPVRDFGVYSPTGNGILTEDCIGERCGLVEKYALPADSARDVREGETQRLALGFRNPGGAIFDVQPQQLPVVFLPGFLGSVIACGSDNLWPGEFATLPNLLKMRLAPDGITNTGCSGTKATGEPLSTVVFEDIYESVTEFVTKTFGDRGAVLGWDWRKRPHESLLALDEKIDELLARDGLGKRQGVGRVVLWGHSYGGMLMRTYLEKMHPEKVARALTLGTPYWGSPKAIFPFAFGVETPIEGPGLDILLKNRELKQLARNLGGLYQLLPSANFGPWLSIDGRAASVGAALGDIGANTALYAQAQGYHRDDYDGFFDNHGLIDVRAVVGIGKASVGAVDLRPRPKGTDGVGVRWVDGDGTVPATSATQGPVGTATPLGDPVHIQHRCRVEHVALANDGNIHAAYKEWLDHGALPTPLDTGECPFTAEKLEFTPGTLGPEPRRGRAAAGGGPMTLAAADAAGLADVVEGGGVVRVVTDHRRPVRLKLRLKRGRFTSSTLTAAGERAKLIYGPVSGTVVISPATGTRRVPVVKVNGKTLAPVLAVAGRPTLRGRVLRVRVRAPAPGVLVATVRRGRAVVGAAGKPIARARTVTLQIPLFRAVAGAVKLRLQFRPRSGPTRATVLTVRAHG